jgi:hypothetical protein
VNSIGNCYPAKCQSVMSKKQEKAPRVADNDDDDDDDDDSDDCFDDNSECEVSGDCEGRNKICL